jgi:hypothetical protein
MTLPAVLAGPNSGSEQSIRLHVYASPPYLETRAHAADREESGLGVVRIVCAGPLLARHY